MAQKFFDPLFQVTPSDDDAFRLGAQEIRALKESLKALLTQIFLDDGSFRAASVPGTSVSGIDKSSLSVVGAAQMIVPAGVVMPFAGAVVPPNYVWCNGASYAVGAVGSTYHALYLALGGVTSFYPQDTGAGTFQVPDLRGRVPVGLDNMQDVGDSLARAGRISGIIEPLGAADPAIVLGGIGGEQKHKDDITEMPGHTHLYPTLVTDSSAGGVIPSLGNTTHGFEDPTHPTSATGGDPLGTPPGSAKPHNNVQPSMFLNYIIRL